ncbi:MAG TPA: methyltransferase domain-containing protein [Steroidobacteraceae bacterium]|nr:methyltransferase domain-containing protein [Steroidobacteraceae bacterium]
MPNNAAAPNAAQIDFWNSTAGQTWAKFQRQLDRQIDPLGRKGIGTLAPLPGERILDIGCGCGQTALELAAAVAPGGDVVAVDVSQPMLEVARARQRAAPGLALEFRQADAQAQFLGAAAFDAAFSRFGVMFFSDPAAAFANIRRALKPAGRLVFVCWRPMTENCWMRVPLEAARPFLPPEEPTDPAAPGPFAFADAARVRSILDAAGFGSTVLDAFDARIGGGDLDESLQLACRIGPLGAALREHPEYLGPVSDAVREALSKYQTAQGVLMPAAVWIVSARNGGA